MWESGGPSQNDKGLRLCSVPVNTHKVKIWDQCKWWWCWVRLARLPEAAEAQQASGLRPSKLYPLHATMASAVTGLKHDNGRGTVVCVYRNSHAAICTTMGQDRIL